MITQLLALAFLAFCLTSIVARVRFHSARKRLLLLGALAAADEGMSGYELAKTARLSCGFVYPALARLVAEGRVRDWWGEPEGEHGLRRRFYALDDRCVADRPGGRP